MQSRHLSLKKVTLFDSIFWLGSIQVLCYEKRARAAYVIGSRAVPQLRRQNT